MIEPVPLRMFQKNAGGGRGPKQQLKKNRMKQGKQMFLGFNVKILFFLTFN